MNAPKGASGYSRKDLSTTLEMTGRGNARDDNVGGLTKKETANFIVQLIASIASAILTALGATSCMGA